MRLSKKKIGKMVKVTWVDAWTEMSTVLHEFMSQGLAIKESVGWLAFYGVLPRRKDDVVIISSERSGSLADFTMIPRGWVIKVEELKNEDSRRRPRK